MSLPALLPNGFLPPGIHVATLPDIIAQFGIGNPRRQELGTRLQELLRVARSTGALRLAFMLGRAPFLAQCLSTIPRYDRARHCGGNLR
jgi:hypothetical protein